MLATAASCRGEWLISLKASGTLYSLSILSWQNVLITLLGVYCRFIYADYALASAVAHTVPRGLALIGVTYDVWCHWIVNFIRRAQNLPESIAIPPDLDLIGAIPKFHLAGHEITCYVRHSLDHTQKVGRMEGEAVERVWSHMNQHSGSTSEQGPGVRTDTINNLAYEWNYEKMVGMGEYGPC